MTTTTLGWILLALVVVLALVAQLRFDVLGALWRDRMQPGHDDTTTAAQAADRANGAHTGPGGWPLRHGDSFAEQGAHKPQRTEAAGQRKPSFHRSGRRG